MTNKTAQMVAAHLQGLSPDEIRKFLDKMRSEVVQEREAQQAIKEAERLLEDFSKDLQAKGLAHIQADTRLNPNSEDCFSFSIFAGLAEGRAGEEMDVTTEKAISNQKPILQFACEIRR